MTTRPKTARTTPTKVPTVAELPVTRAMLYGVRDELIARNDQTNAEDQEASNWAAIKAVQGLNARFDRIEADIAELKDIVRESFGRSRSDPSVSTDTPVTDATRLYFAFLLGASMTAALLAAMGPWLAPPRGDAKPGRLGAVVWSLLMVGWPVWAAVATFQRTFLPWHGAVAGAVALVLALVVPPVSGAVGALPIGGVVGLSALRLAGLVRLAAMHAGWLPRRYAAAAIAGDVVIAVTAVALVAFGLRRRGFVRGWALAALATLAVSVWLQTLEVRPVPAFESLTLAYLTPFFAASYVLVLKAAGRAP